MHGERSGRRRKPSSPTCSRPYEADVTDVDKESSTESVYDNGMWRRVTLSINGLHTSVCVRSYALGFGRRPANVQRTRLNCVDVASEDERYTEQRHRETVLTVACLVGRAIAGQPQMEEKKQRNRSAARLRLRPRTNDRAAADDHVRKARDDLVKCKFDLPITKTRKVAVTPRRTSCHVGDVNVESKLVGVVHGCCCCCGCCCCGAIAVDGSRSGRASHFTLMN